MQLDQNDTIHMLGGFSKKEPNTKRDIDLFVLVVCAMNRQTLTAAWCEVLIFERSFLQQNKHNV